MITVYTCPPTVSDAQDEATKSHVLGALEQLLEDCRDVLRNFELELESLFDVELDPGVGWSFSVAEGASAKKDTLSENVRFSIAGLDGKGGFKLGMHLDPTLNNLARVLSDVCVVNWDMERAAQIAAKKTVAKLPKLPAALEKDQDLQQRLTAASGALKPTGPCSKHELDELFANVHASAPWLRNATTRIWQAARARMAAANGSVFTIPPVLLYGPPGTGKSSLADMIATHAGTAMTEIDASAGAAAFRVAGVEAGWSTRQIGEPLRLIADTGCPNPMIIVNEVDKAVGGVRSSGGTSSSLPNALLPFLECGTARKFHCPASGLVCDMSNVSWILTANSLEHVSAPLRTRCELIEVTALTVADYVEAAEVMLPHDQMALDAVCELIARNHNTPGFSLRHVARAAQRLAATRDQEMVH
ncbi:ATP-binding protein [Cognatishimia sp. 1_MG-2023]|uniref:ATP-binding protein n=1 Tax=Cognatishimia sp. 1_MG-2023 TaxID=3062642 RepID=UPI0026E2AAD2|nr:ATP-binding protein [Cognatishimia sp. 1_MG-2023]MDO6726260.1 ATP-binding protein [Cognatishimia sp. 1_MG-2023]